jgi:hydroxyacylglutathione hydrolase
MSIDVHTITAGPLSTNAHIVICSSSKEAWIVDAPHSSAAAIQESIERSGAKAIALILTHSHWDHFGDAAQLAEALDLPVWAHALDQPNLERPGSDGLSPSLTPPSVQVSRLLSGGDELRLGESAWQVLHTPGHSPGSICLWCPSAKILVSGDTLFKGTYGRTDLATGDDRVMKETLRGLSRLPGETLIFPGHGESSCLRNEAWLQTI